MAMAGTGHAFKFSPHVKQLSQLKKQILFMQVSLTQVLGKEAGGMFIRLGHLLGLISYLKIIVQ